MTFCGDPSLARGCRLGHSDHVMVMRKRKSRRRVQQPGGRSNLWFRKCHYVAGGRYLQISHSGVGCVGELLLWQVARSTLVTGRPTGQEALVTRPVSDCVGCGAGQAEQDRVIGQMDIRQTESHPLPVQVPGSGFLAVS